MKNDRKDSFERILSARINKVNPGGKKKIED